jgi:hypothetical protein
MSWANFNPKLFFEEMVKTVQPLFDSPKAQLSIKCIQKRGSFQVEESHVAGCTKLLSKCLHCSSGDEEYALKYVSFAMGKLSLEEKQQETLLVSVFFREDGLTSGVSRSHIREFFTEMQDCLNNYRQENEFKRFNDMLKNIAVQDNRLKSILQECRFIARILAQKISEMSSGSILISSAGSMIIIAELIAAMVSEEKSTTDEVDCSISILLIDSAFVSSYDPTLLLEDVSVFKCLMGFNKLKLDFIDLSEEKWDTSYFSNVEKLCRSIEKNFDAQVVPVKLTPPEIKADSQFTAIVTKEFCLCSIFLIGPKVCLISQSLDSSFKVGACLISERVFVDSMGSEEVTLMFELSSSIFDNMRILDGEVLINAPFLTGEKSFKLKVKIEIEYVDYSIPIAGESLLRALKRDMMETSKMFSNCDAESIFLDAARLPIVLQKRVINLYFNQLMSGSPELQEVLLLIGLLRELISFKPCSDGNQKTFWSETAWVHPNRPNFLGFSEKLTLSFKFNDASHFVRMISALIQLEEFVKLFSLHFLQLSSPENSKWPYSFNICKEFQVLQNYTAFEPLSLERRKLDRFVQFLRMVSESKEEIKMDEVTEFEELKNRVEWIKDIDALKFFVMFVGDPDQGKSSLQNVLFKLDLPCGIDDSTTRMCLRQVSSEFQKSQEDVGTHVVSIDSPGFSDSVRKFEEEFLVCADMMVVMMSFLTFENAAKLDFVARCIQESVFSSSKFIILLSRFDECFIECKSKEASELLKSKADNLKEYLMLKHASVYAALLDSKINLEDHMFLYSNFNFLHFNEINGRLEHNVEIQEQMNAFGCKQPSDIKEMIHQAFNNIQK